MTKQAKCNSNRVVGALVMLLVLASSEPVGVAGVWLMRVMGTVAVAVVMWEIYKLRKETEKDDLCRSNRKEA